MSAAPRSRATARASRWTAVAKLLDEARGRVFPACQCVVLREGKIVFEAFGARGLRDAAGRSASVDARSPFDLASLTKPLGTAALAMRFVGDGRLDLDRPVEEVLGRPVAGGAPVTARLLLSHASGLPAWRPLHLEVVAHDAAVRRAAILRAAMDTPPQVAAGTEAIYSDLNFLVLTAVLERIGGARLDALHRQAFPDCALHYRPLERAASDRRAASFVASEIDPRRGVLAGRVNDENAWAMGGVAGHAGLFGTARAAAAFANGFVEAWHGAGAGAGIARDVVREFWSRTGIPSGSTWALGWDTPSAVRSSAGNAPRGAVGHLGFTGGSLWIVPERAITVVLLTNRIWPDRRNVEIRAFRPRFHDAVWDALRVRSPRSGTQAP